MSTMKLDEWVRPGRKPRQLLVPFDSVEYVGVHYFETAPFDHEQARTFVKLRGGDSIYVLQTLDEVATLYALAGMEH